MGQLVLAAAGAVVGGMTGFALGPQLGWAIGSTIGGMLLNKKKTTYRTQEMMDLRVISAEYGQPIPWLRGRAAIAGQMWWNTDRIPIRTYTTEESGGKGGGGGEKVITETITYDMDCLIGLTDGEIVGIGRIWANGTLIYSGISGANGDTLNASLSPVSPEHWTRLTVYTGTETQVPDATYEAAVGTANAPAYRGRSYVFIEGLHLGQQGAVPALVFEVFQSADRTTEDTWVARDTPLGSPSSTTEYKGMAYSAELNVAIFSGGGGVGSTFRMMRTVDGTNYTRISSADNSKVWVSCGYYPPLDTFVCARQGSGGTPVIQTSIDNGVTWQLGSGAQPEEVDYGPNTMCYDSTREKLILMANVYVAQSSAPATNWTKATLSGVGSVNIFAVCYCLAIDRLIAVGQYQFGYNTCITSDDGGTTWTSQGQIGGLLNIDWYAVCYAEELNVVVAGSRDGAQSQVARSTDGGVTWTTQLFAADIADIAYAPGVGFMMTTTQGASYLSQDEGLTWPTAGSLGGLAFLSQAVEWCSGFSKWVTVSENQSATAVKTYAPWSTLTPTSPTVESVQSAICLRAGLSASQFDVSALSEITRDVDSFVWGDVSGARDPSQTLMALFFYEATCTDKIYFIPRGRAAVASLAFTDLGASLSDEVKEQFELLKLNDIEMPAQMVVNFVNIDDDYQQGAEYSDRLVSALAVSTEAVALNAGLTPADAKEVADVMLADRAASNLSSTIAVLGERALLIPTDVVTVVDSDSTSYRMRITKLVDSFPLIELDLVLDDTAALTSQRITSTDYTSTIDIVLPVNTTLALLDIPILRDTDDYAGFYVAAKGDGDLFPGAAVFDSVDNTNFTRKVTIYESAVIGVAATTLGAWGGGRVVDWLNSVTVNVGDGTLSSTTRAIVLQSKSVNAMLVGSEIIQFITATLSSAGIYVLTGLLRGCRGTTHDMANHAASEEVVLLREVGLRRIISENSELGTTRYYKGVTLGRALASDTSETFVNTAIALKPFSPVDLRAERDASGNVTFTWRRRTRLVTRFVGSLGPYAPLGEASEAYEIDILAAGSPSTILRTLTATAETVAYTAAQQTTDFGSTQASITARVYQISANVGRGYQLEATA